MTSSGRRVFVVFNPASNGGRGAKRIPRYLSLLEDLFPGFGHGISGRSGEESDRAEEAVREGYDTIVAVGGDGTWSAVADRLLSLDRPDVTLGVLPGGTGNDFGRNLGISGKNLEAAVDVLAGNMVRRVDVGVLNGTSWHEDRGEIPRPSRFFLNVVGFGFDVAVVDAAKGARFLKGELLYKTTAVQQLFRYPGFSVALDDGGAFHRDGSTLMLTISNGAHFGGGFPISPSATVDDGLLHACCIGNAKPFRRLVLFDKAGKGRHEKATEVDAVASLKFNLSFPDRVRFEVDGDVYASEGTELTTEVLPAALPVLAPPA